jgi:hypothetical protein
MQVTFAFEDDILVATGTGRVSVKEVRHIFENAVDTATERGFDKILIDFLEATGEMPALDLYEIGKAMAEFCLLKSIYPKVAVIGNPPIVTGFGAEVASNRGLTSRTFSERQPALHWLRVVGSKAPGRST